MSKQRIEPNTAVDAVPNKAVPPENPEFSLIDEAFLKSRIYTIRGLKVMLDADLAEIYGYETKAFNRQVKNNIEKFDGDFRLQLRTTCFWIMVCQAKSCSSAELQAKMRGTRSRQSCKSSTRRCTTC